MKKRYFHALLLLLLAIMLPQSMRADNQPYVKLAVADGATSISASNSLSLTFYYGTKGTDSDMEMYFDLNVGNNTPGWLGTYSGGVYAYASKVKTATFDSSFADARPTSTYRWFYNCSNLTAINGISNLNTANVKNMSDMFYKCSSLTPLDVSNFNTTNVKNMSGMFYKCSSLTSLNLSNFNTTNMTDMSGLFSNCSNLTSLNLSNWDTSSVTNMRSMFYKCSSLTSLNVSNFNTARVTTMTFMFSGCTNLETITVDIQDWTTDAVTEGADMFTNCTKLNTGKANAFDDDKVTYDYARINSSEHFGYLTLKTPVQKFTYYEDKDMTEKVAQLGSNSIGTLTLNRSNMSTTNYGTICLPVSLTAAQVQSTFGEGTVVKKLTGATFDDTSNILYFNFTEESGIEAGKPYLIKSANATPATIASISISTAEGSSITVKDSQTNDDICTMQGVLTPVTKTEDDKTMLIVSGGELYYSTGGTMKSMRAYFQLKGAAATAANSSNSVKARPRAVISDSSETGILSINADGSLTYEETGDWYTLGGVKLSGKPVTKGMYILNGKKYIVK